jgi:site-specific recombinase XerD
VNKDTQPYAFRRHVKSCNFFGPGGREVRSDKCTCPFHADGKYFGARIRQSLHTTSRQLADRRLTAVLRKLDEKRQLSGLDQKTPLSIRTISDAADRFLRSHGSIDANNSYRGAIEYSSYRKYRTKLSFLQAFCDREGIAQLVDVNLDVLEDYRRSRDVGPITWKVELQALRTFFTYCVRHKWLAANPATEMKLPRNIKPNEIVPYTPREEAEILAACDCIGGGKYKRTGAIYERLRARAMIMVLRNTALRISDVCTLRKDSISWDQEKATWRVFLRTQKTGDAVFLPISDEVKIVLDALPLPRNAAQDCEYYFWNGITSRRAVVGIAERALAVVFKKSGVKNAHAHRYRHTLATRLLAEGASFQEVADVLGNTEGVVRKHYGKWSKGRQDKIDRLMFAHFRAGAVTAPVTHESHEKTEAVN